MPNEMDPCDKKRCRVLPSSKKSLTPMYADFKITDQDHVVLDMDFLPTRVVKDLDIKWAEQTVTVRGFFDKSQRLPCGSRNLRGDGSINKFGAPALWLTFVQRVLFGPPFEMAMKLASNNYISNAAQEKNLTMADGTAPKTMKEVMEMLFEPKMSKMVRDVAT